MDENTYKQQKATALRLFTDHDHRPTDDPETRQNCGACALGGYHSKGEPTDDINYAGWARVYIQAGRYIPKKLNYAFLAELASDNRSYANCLIEDIKAYGINTDDMKFKRHVQHVLGIWE